MISKIRNFQDNPNTIKVRNVIFYIALSIELLIVLIDKSELINPYEGRLFQLTFVFFFIKVLLTKYDVKEYIGIFLFCVLGLLVDHFGDRNEILRAVMFVSACKNVDMKKALKYTFYVTSAGIVLLALLSIFGIGNVAILKEYPGELFSKVYCFGMGNANSFHCMFFVTALLGMYVYNEKLKWWGYCIIFVVNIGLYFLTDSRTAMGMCAVAVIVMSFVKKIELKKSDSKIVKCTSIICIISYLFAVGISVWMASVAKYVSFKYYNRTPFAPHRDWKYIYLQKLDNILTGRISCISETLPFKGAIESWRWMAAQSHKAYFDLGFVRLFYWYGVVPATIILLLFLALEVYLYKKRKTNELIFLSVIAIYTVIEAHFVSVYIGRCYPLFILGHYIFLLFKNKEEQRIV